MPGYECTDSAKQQVEYECASSGNHGSKIINVFTSNKRIPYIVGFYTITTMYYMYVMCAV